MIPTFVKKKTNGPTVWWLKCHKCFCAIAIASLPGSPVFVLWFAFSIIPCIILKHKPKNKNRSGSDATIAARFVGNPALVLTWEQCFLRQSSCQLQLFLLQVTRAFGEKYAFGKAVRELMTLSNVLRYSQSVSHCEEFHEALLVLCTLLAPIAPHISSELWEGECGTSVHQLESLFATLNWCSSSLSPKQEHFCFFLV